MASVDRADTSRDPSGSSKSPSPRSKKDQGKTGKAGSSKKMTQVEQSERFKEAAREIEADESGGAFEAALDRVLPCQAKR